jgi:hypothetical protein
MHQPESSYNIPTTIEQESRASINHLADHLRTSRAAIAQSKLTLARLRRCYSSARMRGVIDQLCTGMDAALSTLEKLDLGPSAGRTL